MIGEKRRGEEWRGEERRGEEGTMGSKSLRHRFVFQPDYVLDINQRCSKLCTPIIDVIM